MNTILYNKIINAFDTNEIIKLNIMIDDLKNINTIPYKGGYILYLSCVYNLYEMSLKLITKGCDVNYITDKGDNCLFVACRNFVFDLAIEILKHGFNKFDHVHNNKTILMICCMRLELEYIAELILQYDCYPNFTDSDGFTAFIFACKNMPNIAIKMLQSDHDILLNHKDNIHKLTGLDYARINENYDILAEYNKIASRC